MAGGHCDPCASSSGRSSNRSSVASSRQSHAHQRTQSVVNTGRCSSVTIVTPNTRGGSVAVRPQRSRTYSARRRWVGISRAYAYVGQTPQHPQRANAAARKYLGRWLAGTNLQQSPASKPPLSEEDARLRVLAEIVRRQGQTQFRNKLLDIYGGRCCATRETAQVVLEAAHISPDLGTKSNRPSNGLLLRADIHTLFDSHLIAVDRRGTWVVSSLLDGTSYAKLRGKKLLAPRVDPPNARDLARHFAMLRT